MIEYIPHPTDPTLVVLKVTKHYIAKHSDKDLQAAVLAEREACAVVCENFTKHVNEMLYPFNGQTAETKFVNLISNIVAKTFSDAIRARGNV